MTKGTEIYGIPKKKKPNLFKYLQKLLLLIQTIISGDIEYYHHFRFNKETEA